MKYLLIILCLIGCAAEDTASTPPDVSKTMESDSPAILMVEEDGGRLMITIRDRNKDVYCLHLEYYQDKLYETGYIDTPPQIFEKQIYGFGMGAIDPDTTKIIVEAEDRAGNSSKPYEYKL